MSYENTSVPVPRSQEGIRNLILSNGGTAVAFISQPPFEGFEAQVVIDAKTYRVRITAECKPVIAKRRRRSWRGSAPKDPQQAATRRVWRVLFYHLKSVYEAANTGVMEFRELMLPYIVTSDNRTIAERILPKLDAAIAGNPARLLMAGNPEPEAR